MNDLPLGIEYFHSVEFLDEVSNGIEHGVNMAFVIAHHRKSYLSSLPQVVIAHLCNGDIKLVFGSINELLENLSLSFKRIVPVNTKVQLANSNNHESCYLSIPVFALSLRT